jgi:hypothetical protein
MGVADIQDFLLTFACHIHRCIRFLQRLCFAMFAMHDYHVSIIHEPSNIQSRNRSRCSTAFWASIVDLIPALP